LTDAVVRQRVAATGSQRIGIDATASKKPMPWLMAMASSSPNDCAHWCSSAAMPVRAVRSAPFIARR